MSSCELRIKLEEIRDCINSDGTGKMIEFYIDDLYGSEISNPSGIKYRMDETFHDISILHQHFRSHKQLIPKRDSILHEIGTMNKPVFISWKDKTDLNMLHKRINRDSITGNFSIKESDSLSDSGEKQERFSRILKCNPHNEKFHLSDFSDFVYDFKDSEKE